MNQQFYETIARFYDAENADMTDDLGLYSELAGETGDPILDVGCGTGRVMLHLAQQGYRVVGIDYSEAMLARGQRKLDVLRDLTPLVTFVHGDALTTELTERFRLILVPYNGLMHFHTQADQAAALRRFRALLADGGQLVLDLPNAGEAFGTQDDGALVLERMFTEPESGHLVMQHSYSTLERITQQLHVTWIYDEIADGGAVRRTLAPLVLRYVFLGEMDLLLALTGLRRVDVYGDYDRAPFVEGSPRMIVVAEAWQ
jgi:ubiquinone/menaquinone biosynthesis C-methylase UbiE